jgi:acyl CoA:acetate/3-ketoacid CoA transferase alpha subunit
MKDYKLLTAEEAGVQGAPEGTYVLQLHAAKAGFAVVFMRTRAGEYLATQLAR